MTTLTNVGREYIDDHLFGRETAAIDTIAVGTGDAPESFEDTALDEQIYESHVTNSNVRITDVTDYPAATYCAIDLHGGTEVPANTEITEIGLVVGENDTLVFRDVKAPVRIEPGIEVTLRLRIDGMRI